MITQTRVILVLLVAAACTDGFLVPLKAAAHYPSTNDTIAITQDLKPAVRPPHPPATTTTTAATQEPHPSTAASTTTRVTTATTEESKTPTTAATKDSQPPSHDSFFSTDAKTPSAILTLPHNESLSRLLFWPLAANTTATLNLTVLRHNYTFTTTTALPKHWHSIDIYQPTASQTGHTTARLHLNTEGRYLTMDHSRVIQMTLGSDHTAYWCFCPRAHLCTLLSPLKNDSASSGERADLLVALLVVVFLLIVTLLALGGVTFYKKAELFHIYAKPIDCLPHVPPPLPTPNQQPASHTKGSTRTKQDEAEQVATKTDKVGDISRYSKLSRGIADNPAQPTIPAPPAVNPDYDRLLNSQRRESINSLYGLI
ncbi:hypothetical protein GWK47_023311 [Chionoecetes opilio]|uniref:Uncharacterized protein n=1 Tax=Chionoecetes opilio TaxID=41210 RepID=A0A8J5CEP4_CHIOP|nr:hypothetical protein GWK47_023311 [Chionoecetes opilio]